MPTLTADEQEGTAEDRQLIDWLRGQRGTSMKNIFWSGVRLLAVLLREEAQGGAVFIWSRDGQVRRVRVL